MNIINKICNKIRKIYYRSSGERYISFLRKKGVQVGEGTIVFNSKDIQIDYSRPELLKIGSNVFLHKGTTILTHDWASFCFVNKYNEFIPSHGKVIIGNNVWLGENVTILKGVSIGDNVIIGYGSIVTKSIPANSVAVGAPAKVICTIDEYFEKRKTEYLKECVDFAQCIKATGREPPIEDFYDDYVLFVDGSNYKDYPYPYHHVFNEKPFAQWKFNHKKQFNELQDFLNYAFKQN